MVALLLLLGCDAAENPGGIYLQPGSEVADQDMFDLDGDDTADVLFQLSYAICSQDIPPSTCSQAFDLLPLVGRAMLSRDPSGSRTLEPGDEVGALPDVEGGAGWSNRGVALASVSYDMDGEMHQVSSSPEPDGVYVGIRVIEEGVIRYGWVRLTSSVEVRGALDATFSATIHEVAIGAPGEAVTVGERP